MAFQALVTARLGRGVASFAGGVLTSHGRLALTLPTAFRFAAIMSGSWIHDSAVRRMPGRDRVGCEAEPARQQALHTRVTLCVPVHACTDGPVRPSALVAKHAQDGKPDIGRCFVSESHASRSGGSWPCTQVRVHVAVTGPFAATDRETDSGKGHNRNGPGKPGARADRAIPAAKWAACAIA